jgi:hypothetical protein
MLTLEQEIVAKFRQLDEVARQRVQAQINEEMHTDAEASGNLLGLLQAAELAGLSDNRQLHTADESREILNHI